MEELTSTCYLDVPLFLLCCIEEMGKTMVGRETRIHLGLHEKKPQPERKASHQKEDIQSHFDDFKALLEEFIIEEKDVLALRMELSLGSRRTNSAYGFG